MTAPRRRWSYSLRTLFVVVTVLGCWLGFELNWIRQRRAFIACETAARDAQKIWAPITVIPKPGQSPPFAPSALWLFGESGYWYLGFVSDSGAPPELRILTENDRSRLETARRLFPEAEVGVISAWETSEESGVGIWTPDS